MSEENEDNTNFITLRSRHVSRNVDVDSDDVSIETNNLLDTIETITSSSDSLSTNDSEVFDEAINNNSELSNEQNLSVPSELKSNLPINNNSNLNSENISSETNIISSKNLTEIITETKNSPTLNNNSNSNPIAHSSKDIKMAKNISIESMLKIIPEFDGSSDTLDRFIDSCDTVFKRIDEDSTDDLDLFLDLIRSKLKNKAYDIVKYKQFKTFTELKTEFKQQFADTRSVEQLQVELVQIRQNFRESVRDFASRVEKLLFELNDACIAREGVKAAVHIQNLNSITAKNSFENGLQEPIRLIIKASRFTNLKDAISKAVEEETMQNNSSIQWSSSNSRNQIKCQLCSRTGHSAPNCYSFKPQQPKPNSDYANNNKSYVNSNLNSNNRPNVHVKSLRCGYCKNYGHNIENCRKRLSKTQNHDYGENSHNSNRSSQNSNSGNANQLDRNNENAVVRANKV